MKHVQNPEAWAYWNTVIESLVIVEYFLSLSTLSNALWKAYLSKFWHSSLSCLDKVYWKTRKKKTQLQEAQEASEPDPHMAEMLNLTDLELC